MGGVRHASCASCAPYVATEPSFDKLYPTCHAAPAAVLPSWPSGSPQAYERSTATIPTATHPRCLTRRVVEAMAGPAFRAAAVRVRVPATSANLGPGFDALGLSLGLYDDVVVRVADSGLHIDIMRRGCRHPAPR